MKNTIIDSFVYAYNNFPFYKSIIDSNNIDVSSIKNIKDFEEKVPVLSKKDIFPVFEMNEIVKNGDISDIKSAILTSGTSGVFAYSVLSSSDQIEQKENIDSALNTFFDTDKNKPLIINSLAMGVTFFSKHPVITTSTRSDMVVHVVKTLSKFYDKTIIVCDPYFAKKIVDEGLSSGIDWTSYKIIFIVGGQSSPNNLIQYILNKTKGIVQGTMGLTELGLNIFMAPVDLINVRNELHNNREKRKEILGKDINICPELFYYIPERMHIEIINKDQYGFGEIVVSNLSENTKNMFIRYNTGDVGKFVEIKDSPLPVIAILGRRSDIDDNLEIQTISEILFADISVAENMSGHFVVDEKKIFVHVNKENIDFNKIENKLKENSEKLGLRDFYFICRNSHEFKVNVDLNYEYKWKHKLKI